MSVIVPAYNSGAHLGETLESVLGQTHRDLEILVVDDGTSDDRVRRIVQRYPAVRYLWQPNAGANTARTTGLRATAGDYVAFLDHDDVWRPEKLEIQLQVAARHPKSGLIACDGYQFDGARILLPRLLYGWAAREVDASAEGEVTGDYYRELLDENQICCPAQTLIPRRVIDTIGPLIADREEPSDTEYYLRIAREYPLTFHRHSLVGWRYLASSRSGPQPHRQFRWALMSIRMLRRLRRLAPPDEQAYVTTRLRALVWSTARAAYDYGRREDPNYARAHLSKLLALAPSEPRVAMYWIALRVPEQVASRLLECANAVRRLVRGMPP